MHEKRREPHQDQPAPSPGSSRAGGMRRSMSGWYTGTSCPWDCSSAASVCAALALSSTKNTNDC